MEVVEFTRFNIDLMKNLPSDMMDELVYLDDVIPDDIMGALYSFNTSYKKQRNHFLDYNPGLLQMMYEARRERKRLTETDDVINVHTNENVQFIRDYPQFKMFVDHIEQCADDKNLTTLKKIPIDEYLAEN